MLRFNASIAKKEVDQKLDTMFDQPKVDSDNAETKASYLLIHRKSSPCT